MEKLKMHTPDLTQDHIARIREFFPNCVTEARDEKGQLKLAVDFDQLKQELSDSIVEGPQERYHLNWPGKREALLTANAHIAKTLRPVREESVDFDTTKNLFIEGDNLDALKLLQETYLGKVKMIYIDPPYNTGSDFVYDDDFAENAEEFFLKSNQKDQEGNRLVANTESNGRFHSDWLSMMYPRLKLCRNVLRDDGVIFISIDDTEVSNLRKICDEVFGEDNFVGNVAWESKTKTQNTDDSYNKLQPKIEHILLYTRGSKRRFNLIQKGTKEYPHKDSRGVFRWHKMEPMNALGIRGRETMIYPILGVMPPEGKQWQIGVGTIKPLVDRDDVKIEDGVPYIKIRPDMERSVITEPFWGFFSKEIGTAESAKKELTSVMGKHGFETVKPVDLIKRLVFHSTEKTDIILDFFSGSATTAHAVLKLNAEDAGSRKFILVQLPEDCDPKTEAFKAGYKTIPEVGKERIRRAKKKILEENPEFKGDLGFRVLKIDTSNMAEVYYTPDGVKQNDLLATVDNIKPDRTPEDLLFQVLLDWGVDLTLPIVKKTIQGKTVFFVDGNALAACFDTGVSEDLIKELASEKPLRVVFRDNGFVSDAVKINAEQIFKQMSPGTDMKSI